MQRNSETEGKEKKPTSVSDLAGVAAGGGGSPLREGNADLAQALRGGARADAVVLGEGDLLPLALGVLDPGLDGHDLVGEQTGFLGALGALEALGGVLVHLLAGHAEVSADVLARPAHGLHAVRGLLRLLGHLLVKGLIQRVTTNAHLLGAESNADLDGPAADGVGDVGNGLEARGAEAVQAGAAGCVGEAGGERGGAQLVSGLVVRDLLSRVVSNFTRSDRGSAAEATHISKAEILNESRVEVAPLPDLLEKGVDQVLEAGVLEAALLRLG